MYQFCVNILFHPVIWRFQFVSNLGVKRNSAIFSPSSHQLQEKRGIFLLNINTTTVYSSQTSAEEKSSSYWEISSYLCLLIYDPVIILSSWNLYIHKTCDWKAMLQMNTDWWSIGCCNKTWASGSDFYFEIIRIASFFTGVTMVMLSCSNVILI